MAKERTAEQIRADLAASRRQFSDGVEGLVSEVHPTTLKNKAKDEAKQKVNDTKTLFTTTVNDTTDGVKGYFVNDQGVRWNNLGTILIIAGSAAAVIGTAALLGAGFRQLTSPSTKKQLERAAKSAQKELESAAKSAQKEAQRTAKELKRK